MKKLFLFSNLMVISLFVVSCSGESQNASPSDKDNSNAVADFFYAENDTKLTAESSKVDVAVSMADIKGCESLGEKTISYKPDMADSLLDNFLNRVEENAQSRWENIARNAAVKESADTVRLIGTPTIGTPSSSLTQTQSVAFYKCRK